MKYIDSIINICLRKTEFRGRIVLEQNENFNLIVACFSINPQKICEKIYCFLFSLLDSILLVIDAGHALGSYHRVDLTRMK